jgi:hypothetical protein
LHFVVAVLGLPTPAKQIANVPVAIFEMFFPTPHTAGAYAGIPIDMEKLITNVCSMVILLYNILSRVTLTKEGVRIGNWIY